MNCLGTCIAELFGGSQCLRDLISLGGGGLEPLSLFVDVFAQTNFHAFSSRTSNAGQFQYISLTFIVGRLTLLSNLEHPRKNPLRNGFRFMLGHRDQVLKLVHTLGQQHVRFCAASLKCTGFLTWWYLCWLWSLFLAKKENHQESIYLIDLGHFTCERHTVRTDECEWKEVVGMVSTVDTRYMTSKRCTHQVEWWTRETYRIHELFERWWENLYIHSS